MSNKLNLFIIIFIFFSVSSYVNAQERIVHGMVTTFDSIPLIGASIEVKSTKKVVKTDNDGFFTVICNNEDKLKVAAKGFFSEKVDLTPNIKIAAINLKLKPGEKNREHAIGYGHVADADKLNAQSRKYIRFRVFS